MDRMDKPFLRRLHRISVGGLYWCYRQIRLAQKTGDPVALQKAVTAKKHYECNIAFVKERRHQNAWAGCNNSRGN